MSNTLKYLDWAKALPATDEKYSSSKCPCCGSLGIRYQYFGFEDQDFGWKLVWCDTCKQGIQISRAKLPTEDASVLLGEAPQQEFLDQHRDLQLVS